MLKPPSLKDIARYPITATTGGAAIAVTALWWSRGQIDALMMNGEVWANWELWRALTAVLPHVNLLHLAFNLYWFWAFGTTLEKAYGHLRYVGILLVLAFGSSFAEFTVLQGGVGLSGVGYGLGAMLWVLERRDQRFSGTIDSQTSQLFIGWFFLCIVLTLTDVMPVGNIAHGVGAVLGGLLGITVSSRGAARRTGSAAIAAIVFMGMLGSTVLWPHLNISEYAEAEAERAGVEALYRSDNDKAARLLDVSAHMKRAPARAWFNLGIAYQRLGNYEAALKSYEHAAGMPDATKDMRQAAQELERYEKIRREARELLGR